MADIGEKLQEILSSPDGMQQLQSAADQLQELLGGSSDLSSLLSGLNKQPAAPPSSAPPDLSLLTKAAPLLGAMQQDDDSAKLLKALRPYLHKEQQIWIDEALDILKWVRLATLLKEQGVL